MSGLSFVTPWILAALALLPAIWFFLRLTPPLPKRVVFPPLALLLGLHDEKETPAGTPWWVLLIRLAAAAAVILALAGPQLGRTLKLSGNGPLILLIDNGWTASADWQIHRGLAVEAVRLATAARRPVAVISTADPTDASLMDGGTAMRKVEALQPRPWLASRAPALAALKKMDLADSEVFWLSDGIDDGEAKATAKLLHRAARMQVYRDRISHRPLALVRVANSADGYVATLLRAGVSGRRAGTLSAYGRADERLASVPFVFRPGVNRIDVMLPMPLEMRNKTDRLTLDGVPSAAAVYLFDRGTPRRAVGVIARTGTGTQEPLLSDAYYPERALSPYADVLTGSISELAARKPSVLILPDVGRLLGADYAELTKFVKSGGVLIRFAGENMAAGTDDLVPVRLRSGGRYLGGALNWGAAQKLAPFPASSPFDGLSVPDDVTVSRQILAEPSVTLAAHSWARLADGTPMVTAAMRGKGWVVLFHVTAGPGWSNLPLSGLYVEMLRQLLPLASGASPAEMSANAVLPPVYRLDGFGRLRRAGADVRPIKAGRIATADAGPRQPPGLYGAPGAERALNAAKDGTALLPMAVPRLNVVDYAAQSSIDLAPGLLTLAALLLFLDFAVSLRLRGLTVGPRRLWHRLVPLVALGMILVPQARAEGDGDAMKAALDTRLAYVVTHVADTDAMSRAGLTGLGRALKARTSYVPQAPVGVDPERDDLSFFPLLYWPMDPREPDLSPKALMKLSDYMQKGGTLLVDTRDLTVGPNHAAGSPGQVTLRRLLGGLDLPPLRPVTSNHVLTRTFYLIGEFPGRWEGGKLWVQAPGADGAQSGDGVSPIIIGSGDWAAAWAVDARGRPIADVSPGGDRQREMAIRFGINVVMYALTGNYKTDQIHISTILKRLEK